MLNHLHPEEISMALPITRPPEVELRGKIVICNVSTTLVAGIPYSLNYFSSILGGSHLLTVA